MATQQTKADDLALLRAFNAEGRKRGLSGEAILGEAIKSGLLRPITCPTCKGDGCATCGGDGFGFLMGERGQA
ncbi:MAG: hypothetical protein RIF41_32295 [Polyangiaceae bacterium]